MLSKVSKYLRHVLTINEHVTTGETLIHTFTILWQCKFWCIILAKHVIICGVFVLLTREITCKENGIKA